MEVKDGLPVLSEKELRTYRSVRNALVGIGEPTLHDQVVLAPGGIEIPNHELMAAYLARGITRGAEAGISRRTRRSAAKIIEQYVKAEKEGLLRPSFSKKT